MDYGDHEPGHPGARRDLHIAGLGVGIAKSDGDGLEARPRHLGARETRRIGLAKCLQVDGHDQALSEKNVRARRGAWTANLISERIGRGQEHVRFLLGEIDAACLVSDAVRRHRLALEQRRQHVRALQDHVETRELIAANRNIATSR